MRIRDILIVFLCLISSIDLYSFLTSGSWQITNISSYNTPNSEYKISYTYKLLGNIVNIGGFRDFTGTTISLYPEILGLSKGPEPDVSKAYVFPNPCNLKYGCRGVAFTKLTLKCEIRIFSISGEHLITINKNSNNESISWDLKDKQGKILPAGLYIFYIKGEDGSVKKGKLIIIR